MLLQKTLHMGQSLPDCKSRLANIHSYRRQFVMVTRATVTSSKTVDFSFRGPLGFQGHTVLLAVESNSPDEVAFESVGGNLDLMGIVDFAEVRPNCTEIMQRRSSADSASAASAGASSSASFSLATRAFLRNLGASTDDPVWLRSGC